MSSEKNAFELQRQVRHNAEEYRNHVKDLYSWEKDIKRKEEAAKRASATLPKDTVQLPVRSYVPGREKSKSTETQISQQSGPKTSSPSIVPACTTPTEKQDLPVDLLAQQHKKANDIKDRGNNYVKLADYDKAIEAYTEAIDIFPSDPIYFINRALCYLKQERFEECIEDCEGAIDLDDRCVKAFYRRMQANESLGNNMEALKDCTSVLTLDPKNAEAKRSLQRINARLRENAKSKSGPNFNSGGINLIDILPVDKPAYKRSKKPLRRVPIVDIVTPRASTEESKPLRISDDDIDKIFNSCSVNFKEVKKNDKRSSELNPTVTKIEEDSCCVNFKEVKKNDKRSSELSPTVAKIEEEATKLSNNPTAKNQNDVKNDSIVVKQPDQSRNKVGSNKITEPPKFVTASVSSIKPTLPPAPTGTAQFYTSWKELSADQKYQYFKSIELEKLCKILGAGFDSDTFSDIVRIIHDYYVPNKEPSTTAALLEMSKNDQFNILSMLMSMEEKTMLTKIMDSVKQFSDISSTELSALSRIYNLN